MVKHAQGELALLGGEPVRKVPYPSWPVFDERDTQIVTQIIKSGNWGGFPYPGPQTSAFIRNFLKLQGGQYAVAMANGTVTLEVACRAAGLGWGDEVIVPAYTFQATAAGPMAAGVIPVIADIDPETYCIAPAEIEAAITEGQNIHTLLMRQGQISRGRKHIGFEINIF